jgi:hypothetical protein
MLNMSNEYSRKLTSKTWIMVLGVAALLFSISLCLPIQAAQNLGQSVTLGWNPDTGTNVAGYAVYYGTNSISNTNRIDVGTNTTVTVQGLAAGITYYFAVSAYNVAHVESAPSAPISYIVPGILTMTPATKSGKPMMINFPVAPGYSFTVQASVDLKTWTNLWQTGTTTSNNWVNFQDTHSGSFPRRYYRLIMTP